jgi:hypothetical protein
MTLKQARALRDTIRDRGIHCTVPLGNGPAGYFARIWGINGQRDFRSLAEWREYDRERLSRKLASRPRSPIELMIDRACGLA